MEKERKDINSEVAGFVIDEDLDLSSETEPKVKSSVKAKKKAKPPVSEDIAVKLPEKALDLKVKNTSFKSLGNIIKVISFIVAFAIVVVHVIAAYILFAFRPLYLAFCFGIVTFGLVVALIVLLLIFALGHILNQNYEILTILKSKGKK